MHMLLSGIHTVRKRACNPPIFRSNQSDWSHTTTTSKLQLRDECVHRDGCACVCLDRESTLYYVLRRGIYTLPKFYNQGANFCSVANDFFIDLHVFCGLCYQTLYMFPVMSVQGMGPTKALSCTSLSCQLGPRRRETRTCILIALHWKI